MKRIYDLLYQSGVTANYTGFYHTAYAVKLCVEDPTNLLLVTKRLYPEVAKQYGTNPKAVERNIRTVCSVIWRENRPLLEQLARRTLTKKPSASQLLAILSVSLRFPQTGDGADESSVPTGEMDCAGGTDTSSSSAVHDCTDSDKVTMH